MKKISLLMAILLVVSALFFGACSSKQEPVVEKNEIETSQKPATAPSDSAEKKTLKIGYVCNLMTLEWYQNLIKGAQTRAAEEGVEIIFADSDMDISRQISIAENYIAEKVDVLAISPVDAKALIPLVQQAKAAGIPVVSQANMIDGSVTNVTFDDIQSGRLAGLWLSNYAKENNLEAKILVIGLPNFEDCRYRVEGFKKGLEEGGANYEILQEVDGGGVKEKSLAAAQDALTANPTVNVIFGINDDSTVGGINAYKAGGLDMDKLIAIGFGFEGVVGRTALLDPGSPYKAALAMFPGYVGSAMVDACISAAKGEELPAKYLTPATVITADSFKDYYEQDGDEYNVKLDAIKALIQ